jgi:hypothetical protein
MAKDKPAEIVVFSIVGESTCGECKRELGKGSLLRREGDIALCLECADLDHLVWLPRGDAALTRRARRFSKLAAVVVRFSRSRKRYERQGLLVEEAALARAEQACLDDAEARARARKRAAARRAVLDEEYVASFAEAVRTHYPGCPAGEADEIARHACAKRSGRVGRSASARRLEADAVMLAVRAHVRHAHTDYDLLLGEGRERLEARDAVAEKVDEILVRWQYGDDSAGTAG